MTTILSSSGSCNKKETGDQCEANPIREAGQAHLEHSHTPMKGVQDVMECQYRAASRGRFRRSLSGVSCLGIADSYRLARNRLGIRGTGERGK